MTIEASDCNSFEDISDDEDLAKFTRNGYSIAIVEQMDEILVNENANISITCQSQQVHYWKNAAGVPVRPTELSMLKQSFVFLVHFE